MKHLLLTTIAAVLLVGTAFADPIHDAAAAGDLAAIRAELDKGVDVNAKDNDGRTPLHYAAKYATKQVVELLIPNGADVNAKMKDGATPLHVAAQDGHKEIAELLIDKGADVDAQDVNGWTPLHSTAYKGHREIVELLIAKDADVNAKDVDGRTPLDLGLFTSEIADLLSEHGGRTAEELALRIAAFRGDLAGVQAQLDAGADVNTKDADGWTPLHYSANYGYKEIVQLLIGNGADVNAKVLSGKYKGKTAVDIANQLNHPETVELLRKHGGRTAEELELMPLLSDIRTYWERVQLAELVINGKVGLKYVVLYSSDLKKWHVMDTITIEASPQVYVDKSATECPHWCLQPMRFYRVKLVE